MRIRIASIRYLVTYQKSQRYQDAKTQAETGKILQEMEKLNQEVAQLREQWMGQLQSQIDAIEL